MSNRVDRIAVAVLLAGVFTVPGQADAQIYYVGDQSTAKDNNGAASYHDGLNWLNNLSPGGVIGGSNPIQYEDANDTVYGANDVPGVGVAVFDPAIDHRPNNGGNPPPLGDEYGYPNYIYFGDFFDERTVNSSKTVEGGSARPDSLQIRSGDYTFDFGTNVPGGEAGSLSTGVVEVGKGNVASLNVQNGELSTGDVEISELQAVGSVTVSQLASWGAGRVYVGDGYNGGVGGQLRIQSGGRLSSNVIMFVHGNAANRSLVEVSGGSSMLNSEISAGHLQVGFGEVRIEDGAQVVNTGANVGFQSGYTALVHVDGPGSSWRSSGILRIGSHYFGVGGSGLLQVTNGGSVAFKDAYLGEYAGSTGRVVVDGATSTWLADRVFSDGVIEVSGGAYVKLTNCYLGSTEGRNGAMQVSAGAEAASFSMSIGRSGQGTRQ
jgi:T5SS/PEP-CTERM-associated repeat protein